MKKSAIMSQMRKTAAENAAVKQRIDGTRQLMLASVMSGDNEQADRLRGELHDLLDLQLDHESTFYMLNRTYIEADDD